MNNKLLNKSKKIFITGHQGMVGSKTVACFKRNGYNNILTSTHTELDLTKQDAVNTFFEQEKPEYVIHIAAKVGGINANIQNPAGFLYDNILLEYNVIHAAHTHGVEKLLFLGSSCIYPKESKQPIKEEYLLTGALEPTNENYAIAKIAGIKLIESYRKQYGFNGISIIPCNIYGPNDSFDLQYAHVLSSLVKRFVDATNANSEKITLWGTGIAKREFLHSEDAAEAVLYFFENYNSGEIINVGSGEDISIKDLADMIARQVGYKGNIEWDSSRPDGMLRKCMDVSKMKSIGYTPKISLEQGISEVIKSYKKIRL